MGVLHRRQVDVKVPPRHGGRARAAAGVCCFLRVLAGACAGLAGCSAPVAEPGALVEGNVLAGALVTLTESPDRLARFRTLGPQEDGAVLDDVLTAIFGVPDPPATEAAVLKILGYVPQVTRNEMPNARTGTACLESGKSYCTGMALAMTALCRRIGLPARVNSLHNFRLMQGHNTVEVYYGDAWHFFDPTYGVFFYTEERYGGGGSIPSLRELMVYEALRRNAFAMSGTVWTGVYTPPAGPQPVTGDFPQVSQDPPLLDFYQIVFTSGFPVVLSDEEAVVFPVRLALDAQGAAAVGRVDGDTQDVYGPRTGGRYARFHGMPHIGDTTGAEMAHGLYLSQAQPGRYRITYHFIPGMPLGTLGVLELRSAVVGRMGSGLDHWWVECYLQEPEAALLVAARTGQAYVDGITVARVDPAPVPARE